jgi:hypothetical protein
MKFVILIPVYRENLSEDEQISIQQLFNVYPTHEKLLLVPRTLKVPEILDQIPAARFDRDFFDGTDGYNNLLMSSEFYERFDDWDYILIYQLDCLIFKSDIHEWCGKGYSYIGAPWFGEFWHDHRKGLWKTGNGGFSLRRVQDALRVLRTQVQSGTMKDAMSGASGEYYDVNNPSNHHRKLKFEPQIDLGGHIVSLEKDLHRYPLNEDIFWSFEAERLDSNFIIPSPQKALPFAFEKAPRWCYRRNWWRLPTGCHAWAKEGRDFWLKYIEK